MPRARSACDFGFSQVQLLAGQVAVTLALDVAARGYLAVTLRAVSTEKPVSAPRSPGPARAAEGAGARVQSCRQCCTASGRGGSPLPRRAAQSRPAGARPGRFPAAPTA